MTTAQLQAYPPSHRLRQRHEFIAIGHQGRKHDTRYLRAFAVAAANETAHARIGITVTKRVGNAVVRNRIKRHVREAFRVTTWPAGIDIVMIATAAAATATGPDLAQAVQTLAGRLTSSPPGVKVRP